MLHLLLPLKGSFHHLLMPFKKFFLPDHLPALYDKTCCTNFSSPMMFIPSNICRTLPSHLAITAWSIPISSAALLHTASQLFQPPLSFVLFILSVSFSDLSFHFVLLIFHSVHSPHCFAGFSYVPCARLGEIIAHPHIHFFLNKGIIYG